MATETSSGQGGLPSPPMETPGQFADAANAANDNENKQKRARTSKPKVKTGCNNCK